LGFSCSSAYGTFNRYWNTVNHVNDWFSEEPAKRRTSLEKARKLHHHANKLSVAKYNYSMSQLDMVCTQWAFIGPLFVFPERVGFPHISREDLEAIAHLFYVIGYILGISDEFNLCAGSVEDVRRYCEFVLTDIVRPGLKTLHPLGHEMVTHIFEGTHYFNPLMNQASVTASMLKACEAESYSNVMKEVRKSWRSWMLYHMMEGLNHFFVQFPKLGKILMKYMLNPLMHLQQWVVNQKKNDMANYIKRNEKKVE